ncbi:TIGR03862 family flavoprotein [Defluviimonas sp. WL0024]|uniref:TIGR03862 family flavoprotein n=2 Tax=Albidovulum salinarum TaxID=2984153 RepID=A0ABT2X260_9RHOB|nr:TIGR03862 family flavoprotein [Defluviimonas sp. WL0024]MCU9848018.1 TIGR03862 family flavoprotein [Defluviimonas sp. WL0024]
MAMRRVTDALVIGAGPAGLMAAEALAAAGRRVVICEAKPSPARKFLMAGKSGLNLTKDEPFADFVARYDTDWLRPMLEVFGPDAVMGWARGLGQEVFAGSTGRVFPVEMKASPLLRAWLARLAGAGVELRTRWRWSGFDEDGLAFETPEGWQFLHPAVTVLALGGASWARLGSDAAWVPWLAAKGVDIAPFKPANMGFRVEWSEPMARFFGTPVKGVALHAGNHVERGEFVISARGIEGGGIYAVSRAVREGATLTLDLVPERSLAEVAGRLAPGPGKETAANWLRKALKLDPVRIALLQEWGRPLPKGERLARLIKALPVRHAGPRPLDEAISVAGGIRRAALSEGLELQGLPGIFACGEMLDWEAPTGGYLLTACLATGLWAGRAAANGSRT